MRCLVDRGARLDLEEQECFYTPLALALALKNEWVASELLLLSSQSSSSSRLRSAINLNQLAFQLSPRIGSSPMLLAVKFGLTAIIRQVYDLSLQSGSAPLDWNQPVYVWTDGTNVNEPVRRSMIHVALENDQLDVLSLLLEIGVDVNKVNEFGDTPLLTALIKGAEAAACLLLRAGARVDIPSPHLGRFPMYA